MPLLIGGTTAPPPVVLPPVNPPAPDQGRTAVTWEAPDGTTVPLTGDPRWRLLRGVAGLGAPSVGISAEPLAAGGTQVLAQHVPHRLITLPIRVGGASRVEFLARFGLLADLLGQTDVLGPGRLVVARPGGRRRSIAAYYQDGMSGDGHGTGHLAETVVVTLYCPDPWWVDVDPVRVVRSAADARPFLDPYPSLSSGRTLGDTTVINPGRVAAYPVWTVTGPAAALTATSHRLAGAAFTLDLPAALTAGQTVTVVTDPVDMAVTGPAGQDWTGALDWPGAELWPLLPGDNPVTFTVTGSGAGSAVELAFNPRHRTA